MQPANATFINNATGLSSPGSVVTFDGSGFAQNTAITNQFAGVTFSPNLLLQPTNPQCVGCTGFSGDFVANFFTGGAFAPTDFIMQFDQNVSEAVFAMAD